MTEGSAMTAGIVERLVRNAYEEGVEDGIEWQQEQYSEFQPQWIDSVARVELLKALASLNPDGGR